MFQLVTCNRNGRQLSFKLFGLTVEIVFTWPVHLYLWTKA